MDGVDRRTVKKCEKVSSHLGWGELEKIRTKVVEKKNRKRLFSVIISQAGGDVMDETRGQKVKEGGTSGFTMGNDGGKGGDILQNRKKKQFLLFYVLYPTCIGTFL